MNENWFWAVLVSDDGETWGHVATLYNQGEAVAIAKKAIGPEFGFEHSKVTECGFTVARYRKGVDHDVQYERVS